MTMARIGFRSGIAKTGAFNVGNQTGPVNAKKPA